VPFPEGPSACVEPGVPQLQSLDVKSRTPGAGTYTPQGVQVEALDPKGENEGVSFTHDKARGDLGVRELETDAVHYREEEWERRERERDLGSRAFQNSEVRLLPHKQAGPSYDAVPFPEGRSAWVEPAVPQLQSLDVKSRTPGPGRYELPALDTGPCISIPKTGLDNGDILDASSVEMLARLGILDEDTDTSMLVDSEVCRALERLRPTTLSPTRRTPLTKAGAGWDRRTKSAMSRPVSEMSRPVSEMSRPASEMSRCETSELRSMERPESATSLYMRDKRGRQTSSSNSQRTMDVHVGMELSRLRARKEQPAAGMPSSRSNLSQDPYAMKVDHGRADYVRRRSERFDKKLEAEKEYRKRGNGSTRVTRRPKSSMM